MRKTLQIVLLAFAVAGFARAASASTLTYQYDVRFSNTNDPGGPAPWMTAIFNDTTAQAGYDVRLTLLVNGLTGTEFISGVYFSLTEALIGNVTGTFVSGTNAAFVIGQIGNNSFQADGDGIYDLLLNFNESNSPRATDNNIYVFDFNLTTGALKASDFAVLAAPGGGNGPFYTAAHLQGIGPNGALSTWIADGNLPCPGCTIDPTSLDPTAVPEPASMLLLGSGLLGMVRMVRRRKA